jgi:S-adenosylmethionine synthetase
LPALRYREIDLLEFVAESYRVDPRAYCQVEVSVWSDQVWISGGIATREAFERPLDEIVREVGRQIGYGPGNAIDVDRYEVADVVCRFTRDPRDGADVSRLRATGQNST